MTPDVSVVLPTSVQCRRARDYDNSGRATRNDIDRKIERERAE